MLRTRAVAALALVTMAVCGPVQAYGGETIDPPPATPTPGATGTASGGLLSVQVSVAGSTSGGRTFQSSSVHQVPPVCWYGRGMSGLEYFEYWKPGGPARQAGTLDAYAAQGLLHAGWEEHGTDATGYWYDARCAFDAPTEYRDQFYATHPAGFVPAGAPAPVATAEGDTEVLAQIAFEALELPEGEIRWSPSMPGTGATVVNLDTWVWVEEAPTTVSVTASIPSGTWARVDAALSGLTVSAPGADTVTCPDAGTPWAPGATATTCALTFHRSTAGEAVKAGQAHPTATLTAQATWTASWVSSVDATPTALPAQTITNTAEVAVAEIQGVVTRDT